MILIFIKKIKIFYWWNFIIKKDKFHFSLNKLPTDKNKIALKREIANLLDENNGNVFKLPEHLLKKF